MTARLLIVLTALSATTIVMAQVTPSGGGHLFRMKHTKGGKHRYSMNITSTGAKIPGGKQEQSIHVTLP